MSKSSIFLLSLVFLNICEAGHIGRKVSQAELKCGSTEEEKMHQLSDIRKCGPALYFIRSCSPNGSNAELNIAANKICDSAFIKKIAKVDLDLKKRMVSRCKAVYCGSKSDTTICVADLATCETDANDFIMQFYLDNDY